ncbi:MAG TPA: V-type ATP synthase subunit F [Clostridia bacterium]|nr:V-type ATP synthase subunit F [Clostridia bacterium]HPQ46980.1 V-type ATP synthase subunit F [Clostridia bacterium]HRX42929.1 V-type ATP synthase subunit F [Clostridia bacterium]
MKFHLISDNVDTQKGMRLAGIDGVVVHSPDEVAREIDSCLKDKEIGIILITEVLAAMIPSRIDDIRLNMPMPLIVVIPDRHGTKRKSDSITRYVRDAIGVKI